MIMSLATLLFLKQGITLKHTVFFCRPDLIKYENLRPSNCEGNLQNAFNVAWEKLGIPKLLDPEGNVIT